MSSIVAPELLESVYSFLMKNGHQATAKSLAKEAKLDEVKLKNSTPVNLMEICPPSLKYVITMNNVSYAVQIFLNQIFFLSDVPSRRLQKATAMMRVTLVKAMPLQQRKQLLVKLLTVAMTIAAAKKMSL